jgi:hypothetical protein
MEDIAVSVAEVAAFLATLAEALLFLLASTSRPVLASEGAAGKAGCGRNWHS